MITKFMTIATTKFWLRLALSVTLAAVWIAFAAAMGHWLGVTMPLASMFVSAVVGGFIGTVRADWHDAAYDGL